MTLRALPSELVTIEKAECIDIIHNPRVNNTENVHSTQEIDILPSNKKKRKRKKKRKPVDVVETVKLEVDNLSIADPDEATSIEMINFVKRPRHPLEKDSTKSKNQQEPCDDVWNGIEKSARHNDAVKSESSDVNASKSLPCSTPNGSYPLYYDKRHAAGRGGIGLDDPRLPILKKEWFQGKRCIDIGCNAGIFTIAIAQKFGTSSMIGLDIDASLIAQANRELNQIVAKKCTPTGANMVPRSLRKAGNASLSVPEISPEISALRGICFRVGNFLEDSAKIDKEFDVICSFSTTKWVHLYGGDDAIKKMFKKIFDLLSPGGHFILEAQSWKSYSKNKNVSAVTAKNFESILLPPAEFKAYLLGSEVGFSSFFDAGKPAAVSKGFRRPINVYTK